MWLGSFHFIFLRIGVFLLFVFRQVFLILMELKSLIIHFKNPCSNFGFIIRVFCKFPFILGDPSIFSSEVILMCDLLFLLL